MNKRRMWRANQPPQEAMRRTPERGSASSRYDASLFIHLNDRAREPAIEEQRKRLRHEMKMLKVALARKL